jgi:3-oxoacyl-[acyl-carrier-protein] synthase-3
LKTATLNGVGILALASSAPPEVITNDYWRENHPDAIRETERRLWMWKPDDLHDSSPFNLAMEPYVRDPFRGARERRFLEPGQSALTLETQAAMSALRAASMDASDVDLLICTSFPSDEPGIGGAAFLARALGLRGASWNLESACASMPIAVETAVSFIAAGRCRTVLVVTSCTYSRVTRLNDPLSWGVGDGAAALLIGKVPAGQGLVGAHSKHSAETIGAVEYRMETLDDGTPWMRLAPTKLASRLLRDTAERQMIEITGAALREAGLTTADVTHVVVNTPLAWWADFTSRVLSIPRERVTDVYPIYANTGPALPGLGLHHAAVERPLHEGDVVLLYSVGSVSSCAALVIRWSDTKLGALPAQIRTPTARIVNA